MFRLLNKIHSKNKYFRKTDPNVTQSVWKCLESIDFQKNRIGFIKKLFDDNSSVFESYKQLKTIIDNLLNDKLIAEEIDPRLGFRLQPLFNRQLFSSPPNDWYCFECHTCAPNEQLIGCQTCFRSFHGRCLQSNVNSSNALNCEQTFNKTSNTSKDILNEESEQLVPNGDNQSNNQTDDCIIFTANCSDNSPDFECGYCRRLANSKVEQMCGQKLHHLLQLFLSCVENQLEISDYSLEQSNRLNVLLFHQIDLNVIRLKVYELRNYTCFVEFQNDLRHFCHNYSIIKGKHLINSLIDAIDYELQLLDECVDCYLWIRAPVEDRIAPEEWFTSVCTPPHSLLYAKVCGYQFWPSKVISYNSNTGEYKVKFFEEDLFRIGIVAKTKTKPIDTKFDSKLIESPEAVKGFALLYKYLTNLRKEDSNSPFDDFYKHLKGVLTRKLRKHGYPFLMAFGFEKTKDAQKKNGPHKKAIKRKLNLSLNESKRIIDSNSQLNVESNDPQNDCQNNDNNFEPFEDSNDAEDNPLKQLLNNPDINQEIKFDVCSLFLSHFCCNPLTNP